MRKKLWAFGVIVLLFTTVLAGGHYARGHKATDVSIAAAAFTASGTINIDDATNFKGVLGEIILRVSDYTKTSWGDSDGTTLVLRSKIGSQVYTLETVTCSDIPCTLTVANFVDSLFGRQLYLDWSVTDSLTVATDCTAYYPIIWNIKLVE